MSGVPNILIKTNILYNAFILSTQEKYSLPRVHLILFYFFSYNYINLFSNKLSIHKLIHTQRKNYNKKELNIQILVFLQ